MWVEARVTRGGKTVPAFQIDEEFAGEVGKYRWSLAAGRQGQRYLGATTSTGKKESLHRFVWRMSGRPTAGVLDHINGDRLDNRLENLRPASLSLNSLNRQSLGVERLRSGRFYARFRCSGKRTIIGTFATQEEAHQAYLRAKEQAIKEEAEKCGSTSSSA